LPSVAFIELITPVTLILTLALASFLLSRKERSLKLWATSLLDTAQVNLKDSVETYKGELIELGNDRLEILKTDLNQWSSNSILALRTWLMDPENLKAISQKLVIEPVTELMKSQSMSFLGKMSGESRRANSVANGIAEEVMPEKIKMARDMILKVAPQLKPVLKNPAKILQLANSFGIDLNSLTPDGESSNTGKSRW